MYFKDLARFVFYCDGLHRGNLCFLKIGSCKRAELRYISIFEFFPCRMHKCSKKCPHNGRFYTRDVKVVWTHLTSETLKPSGSIKTGRPCRDAFRPISSRDDWPELCWTLKTTWRPRITRRRLAAESGAKLSLRYLQLYSQTTEMNLRWL